MFASKDLFFTRPSGYQISRSVRLRSSASAYLNRTPASASNRKTWTWSGWVKRGLLSGSSTYEIFTGDNGATSFTAIRFISDVIYVQDFVSGSKNIFWQTTAVFRDPSAWYHVVVKYDTTQTSSTNSVLVYVNGVSQTLTFTALTGSYVQNYDGIVNSTVVQKIGDKAATNYFDGYLTEINFIDGQALTPSSFGQTNSVTGVWQPIKYTGTYGTNGFYLNFSDNSAATAAAIGKDYSGNGNNWTPNNISVTAGVTYDSMLDVPTPYADGGNGRGNYAVLNPLQFRPSIPAVTFSQGNLVATGNYAAAAQWAVCSIFVSSGKYYCEFQFTTYSSGNDYVGIIDDTNTQRSLFVSYAVNNIVGLALDADAKTVQYYVNNTPSGSAVSLTGNSFALMAGLSLISSVASVANANFGQRPFTYTPPTGFVALNTYNLPTPTITNGATVMAASLYTGTSGNVTVSNAVNGVSFQPDFLWVKARSNVQGHSQIDSVRGANKLLQSNLTNAESTLTNPPTFNSNGFTSTTDIHTNGYTYVAWQWQAGQGSSSSNTSGSITSTVSVNATAGFSVVTYTGTGAAATVGHGLGVAPKMVIVKARNSVEIWCVYHASIGAGNYLALQSTIASTANTAVWNNTTPTSSVFSVAGSSATGTAQAYVAYCWSEVSGYSKFGSYTGNGSTDGPFVYCGFRPRFVMLKRTDTTGSWIMWDTARNTYNQAQNYLLANASDAEANNGGGAGSWNEDILSNGFKIRSDSSAAQINGSGGTYIFMAFAENPFKLSLAR